MNYSFIMILCLVLIIIAIALLIRHCIKTVKSGSVFSSLVGIVTIAVLLITMIPFSAYSWPFDITIVPEQIAELDSSDEIDLPAEQCWNCVYDVKILFGILGSEESYWKLPEYRTVTDYPEFDFDKYTYLFSYERKVSKLSYNVWDNKGPTIVDFGTATKWGAAELSDEVYENKIFIYRFRKVAVDNIAVTKYGY